MTDKKPFRGTGPMDLRLITIKKFQDLFYCAKTKTDPQLPAALYDHPLAEKVPGNPAESMLHLFKNGLLRQKAENKAYSIHSERNYFTLDSNFKVNDLHLNGVPWEVKENIDIDEEIDLGVFAAEIRDNVHNIIAKVTEDGGHTFEAKANAFRELIPYEFAIFLGIAILNYFGIGHRVMLDPWTHSIMVIPEDI